MWSPIRLLKIFFALIPNSKRKNIFNFSLKKFFTFHLTNDCWNYVDKGICITDKQCRCGHTCVFRARKELRKCLLGLFPKPTHYWTKYQVVRGIMPSTGRSRLAHIVSAAIFTYTQKCRPLSLMAAFCCRFAPVLLINHDHQTHQQITSIYKFHQSRKACKGRGQRGPDGRNAAGLLLLRPGLRTGNYEDRRTSY